MDEALAGIKDFRKIVDDVVIFDHDEQEHVEHVRQILQRCQEKNISLNREKIPISSVRSTVRGIQVVARRILHQ